MKVTVGIVTYNESATIGRAIDAFLNEVYDNSFEILVYAGGSSVPVVREYAERDERVVLIEEKVKSGKPAGLNLIFKRGKGDVFVLTDGDVLVGQGCVRKLLASFSDPAVGAVSGRPIPTNSRDSMLGFWQHFLCDVGAHQRRLESHGRGEFLVVSGYLFALRRGIFSEIPIDSLADDGVMSYMVSQRGYKICYAPDAKVYVKYPTTFRDWVKQKIRTTGGYNQAKQTLATNQWRSLTTEAREGSLRGITYCRNARELAWMTMLAFARLYVWGISKWAYTIRNREFSKIWVPIESTK